MRDIGIDVAVKEPADRHVVGDHRPATDDRPVADGHGWKDLRIAGDQRLRQTTCVEAGQRQLLANARLRDRHVEEPVPAIRGEKLLQGEHGPPADLGQHGPRFHEHDLRLATGHEHPLPEDAGLEQRHDLSPESAGADQAAEPSFGWAHPPAIFARAAGWSYCLPPPGMATSVRTGRLAGKAALVAKCNDRSTGEPCPATQAASPRRSRFLTYARHVIAQRSGSSSPSYLTWWIVWLCGADLTSSGVL